MDGQPTITVGEESHVVLSSDTSSIDGAEPPEETLADYQDEGPLVFCFDFRNCSTASLALTQARVEKKRLAG